MVFSPTSSILIPSVVPMREREKENVEGNEPVEEGLCRPSISAPH